MAGRRPHTKHMSDADRLARNARIKSTSVNTRARRKNMIVRVRELKIIDNKLTALQRNQLSRMFAEAKWLRNSALGAQRFDRRYLAELGGQVEVRLPGGVFETRTFDVLGGQLMQAVIDELRSNLKGLAALKKNGRTVGRLRFTREVTSINLVQFDHTYKINRDNNTIKVANITGWVSARGMAQLDDVDEIANAKIVSRPNGYFLLLTTYTAPQPNVGRATQDFQPDTWLGIDMGVATHVTLSDGSQLDALFEETDRLKRLRRKLARQIKGSANYRKTLRLIRVESAKITRQKNDCANKIVHEILKNQRVFIQDENISSWKMRSGYVRGGKRIQHSLLGRIKNCLINHPRVTVVDRWAATTATCVCETKTRHHVSKRVFSCPTCGHTDDRDTHAAKNMIRFGIASQPDRPGQTVTPAEISVSPVAPMDFTFIALQTVG